MPPPIAQPPLLSSMALTIEYRPVISGAHLKSPIVLKDSQEVEGATYFKVVKSDAMIARLFVKDQEDRIHTRPLSKTDIVEQVSSLRNSAYYSLLEDEDEMNEGKEDLGLDGPVDRVLRRNRPRKSMDELPKVVTLSAPDITDIAGVQMRVLMHKPGQALWVELNEANLNYFRLVVEQQIEKGDIKRHHARDTVDASARVVTGSKGVTFSYKRRSVRVKSSNSDGKPMQRYFKVQDNMDATVARASTWLDEVSLGIPPSDGSEPLPLADEETAVEPTETSALVAPLADD